MTRPTRYLYDRKSLWAQVLSRERAFPWVEFGLCCGKERLSFGGARSTGQADPMTCPTPDFCLGLHRAGTPPRYPGLRREEPAKVIFSR